MARKKFARRARPLTIDIVGKGVDLHASFEQGQHFGDLFTALIARVLPESPSPEHDFDVVMRVIDVGSPEVLRAMIDRASAKLEVSGASSAVPRGSDATRSGTAESD